MEIEQAIYDRLAATSALTDLVADRIYPDEADQDADRPLVVYTVVSTDEDRDIAGVVRLKRHTVNVWCEAETFAEVKAIAEAVGGDNRADGGGCGCLVGTFTGVLASYRQDYQTADADNGRFEALQTFLVIQ